MKPRLVVLLICVATSLAVAQSVVGTPPFASFSGGPFDLVNNSNLDVHFTIPILSKAGRGAHVNYGITYDSSIWEPVGGYWVPYVTPNWGWNTLGSALTGSIVIEKSTLPCYIIVEGVRENYPYTAYFIGPFVDSSNTSHPGTVVTTHAASTQCNIPAVTSASSTATDSSGYTVSVTNYNQVVITGRNGISIIPTSSGSSIIDSNGNVQSWATSGSTTTFTDTLGDTALTADAVSPTQTTYSYTAPSGATAQFSFNYTQTTVQTNFGCSGITEYPATPINLLTSITLPDTTQYLFTYEQTPGEAVGIVTGRLASVQLPTGATISYNYGSPSITCADGIPEFLNRTTPDGEWNYTHTEGGSTWKTYITDPQRNTTTSNFVGLFESQRIYAQNGGGTLLTVTTCFNAQYANCATTWPTSQITQTDVYSSLPNGSTRLSETKYNSYGLVTDDKEYTYGVTQGSAPSATYLVSDISTLYATLGNGIVNRPSSITTTDWTGGTAKTIGYTGFGYDQGPNGSVTATTGTPQHVPVSGSRGNLTTVSNEANSSTTLSRTFTYYDTGNPNVATDVNGAQTTYVYGSGSCGNSFPTTIDEPLTLSQSITWNCTGGVLTKVTDENGNNVTTNYTDPYFWRPANVYDQLNNETTISYIGQTAVETALSFNSGHSVADFRTTIDGLGRSILGQRLQGPGATNYDSVETDYNSVGQPSKSTMPFSASAGTKNSSAPGVSATYDALGRVLTATDADGGTVSYTYTNNDVLQKVSGTQTFQKQLEYDGLGRLTSVCEISSTLAGAAACGQSSPQTGFLTKYSYDALGHLLTVTQNAQPGGTHQTRSFAYDLLGRMTSESNPETANSGTNGTTTYTYDSYPSPGVCGGVTSEPGDLMLIGKPNGDWKCFIHDALHRVTDGEASGTDSGNCFRFRYDNTQGVLGSRPTGVTISNTLGRLAEASTDNCSNYTPITDEWFSYSARGENTDAYEKTSDSGGYYHTTAGYWANGAVNGLSGVGSHSWSFGVDAEGRPNSAMDGTTSLVPTNGAAYNTASQPTSITLGSGDSDSYTYDPNTGRMNTFQYKVGSTPKYVTGTLGWNPNGSLGSLLIADSFNTADAQNCGYSYDDLVRLQSVSCGPTNQDGTIWGQTFSYDAFGNIAKNVPQSMTGITFAASYQLTNGTTNNQEQSVSNCVPTYDGNGNLTTDCTTSNTYTWDAYGHLLCINGCSAGISITYDAFDRAVEVNAAGTKKEILYSPIGKVALMAGTNANNIFLPLPGGEQATYTSSTIRFRHYDWLGSARFESNMSEQEYGDVAYAPFGETYSIKNTPYVSFTGQQQDTVSGTYDFPFREYNAVQGRWISPDPAGLAAVDPTSPQSWNRYAYVSNSPLASIDQLGLDWVYACVTAAGTSDCDWTWTGSGDGAGPGTNNGGNTVGSGSGGGANNGKSTCFPTSSLNWSQKAQLTAAQFYAGLTGWTFGFGAGLDAGAGIGPKGSSWNFGAGGSASTLIVADGAGNSGFLNSASGGFSAVKMSGAGSWWGAGAAAGPSVLVSPNPISTIAGPSGSFSAGGGAVLGAGISVTTSGAATVTFGVGAGAEAGVSPQFGTSQFIPFCHN